MNVTDFLGLDYVSTTMEPENLFTGLEVSTLDSFSDIMSTTIIPDTTTAAPDVRSWLSDLIMKVC